LVVEGLAKIVVCALETTFLRWPVRAELRSGTRHDSRVPASLTTSPPFTSTIHHHNSQRLRRRFIVLHSLLRGTSL